MSWKADRYGKSSRPSRDRRQVSNTVFSKTTTKLRADDQRMVTRFAMETNEALQGGALESIFGSSSAARALLVMLRIKRAKRRDAALLTWEDFSESNRIKARRHLPKRNMHHMTPEDRKGRPFFGEGTYNLLLMKISRHDLLHKVFGVRTWEEIIILLARCVKIAWHASFGAMIDALVPELPRKKTCRRMLRRSLRKLQLLSESPGSPGAFFIDETANLIV